MPSNLRSVVLPQRHDGAGWQTVPVERATAWLAVPLKGSSARYETKRAAKEHNARADRLAKPQRTFSFGARTPPRLASRRLLAHSINHEYRENDQ